MIQTCPCISARNPALWCKKAEISSICTGLIHGFKHELPAWQVVNDVFILTIRYIDVKDEF